MIDARTFFYLVGPRPAENGRYFILGEDEVALETLTDPVLNQRHLPIYVHLDDIEGRWDRFEDGTSFDAFLTKHMPWITKKIPILDYEPPRWRLIFDVAAVREIRRAQLKENFNEHISDLFPIWKQVNMQRDLNRLIAGTGESHETVPELRNRMMAVLKPTSRGWLAVWSILRDIRSRRWTYPKNLRQNQDGWLAVEYLTSFMLIDRLRAMCNTLETNLDALTTLDDVLRFQPDTESMLPPFLDSPWP